MPADDLRNLLLATSLLLALSTAFVVTWRMRNSACIGRVRWKVLRRRRARVALMLAASLVALGVVAGSQIGREPVTLAVLALSLALILVCPGFQDSVWGEKGVQRGWYARRLEQLEAWRLIGLHLRWKLFGEWIATDVPISEHASLRLELEQRAPGRESVHGNAGLDPERVTASKSNP